MIVDSQIHLFDPANVERLKRVEQVAPSAADLIATMDDANVDRAYLVPSGSSANPVCVEARAAWPDRFNVFGALSLAKPASRNLLATWKTDGMTGIRLTFPPFRPSSWLKDGTADWVWPAAASAGIPIMIWAPGQLDEIADIARRHPSLNLVVDHLNLYVDEKGPVTAELTKDLSLLAQFDNVAVKASALPAHSLEEYPFRDVHPAIEIAYDAFGPQRVFWGTDLTRLKCSMTEAVALMASELSFASQEDIDLMMGEAILQWVGWI